MVVVDTNEFAAAILSAPAGVGLLARIEARAAGEGHPPPVSSPSRVEAALRFVEEVSFGKLLELAVYAVASDLDPWNPESPINAAAAYRNAEQRGPIATAVAERFSEALHRTSSDGDPQWWTTNNTGNHKLAPLFEDFETVYEAGQFTWAGLRTVTDPPDAVHAELTHAWEMYGSSVSRWKLPVRPNARVFEIHRPVEWARLVITYPAPARGPEAWELPNRNQDHRDVKDLLSIEGQRATRQAIRTHLVPDWRAVADDFDGVHLSWAGLITCEGCITDLGDGDVAMLRYWFSERTLWLADVFGEPEPLPAPHLPDETSAASPASGAQREQHDRLVINDLLGRST